MPRTVMPMRHESDVRTTAHGHASIGFTSRAVHDELEVITRTSPAPGQSEVLLDRGGRVSTAGRRDVDLCIAVSAVDEAFAGVTPLAELVDDLHDTEFGQPIRRQAHHPCGGHLPAWLPRADGPPARVPRILSRC